MAAGASHAVAGGRAYPEHPAGTGLVRVTDRAR